VIKTWHFLKRLTENDLKQICFYKGCCKKTVFPQDLVLVSEDICYTLRKSCILQQPFDFENK